MVDDASKKFKGRDKTIPVEVVRKLYLNQLLFPTITIN
jgi:hypothetical protein